MTHEAFALSEDVLSAFEQQHGVKITVLTSGDAGLLVNQAILAKGAPLADVLYGVDNSFLSRALDAGIFEPHTAPGIDGVPESLRLDPQDRVTPIDYGDVCLNLDPRPFDAGTLPRPVRLEDLTRPGLHAARPPARPAPSRLPSAHPR